MSLFVWNVFAETEKETFHFPTKLSDHKLTTDEIREYILKTCKKEDVKIPANEIYNLTLFAADFHDHVLMENLAPDVYWPIEAQELLDDWKYFRVIFKNEEGGEK